MPEPAAARAGLSENYQGQPCIRLHTPQGDTALVALQGAQVLSWVAGGRERLYLSPRAVLDGQAAIRGGIPLCFPQFNQRGPLPKHGFARNLAWSADAAQADAERARAALTDEARKNQPALQVAAASTSAEAAARPNNARAATRTRARFRPASRTARVAASRSASA